MAHTKLLAVDLLFVTIRPTNPPSFYRPLSRSLIFHAEFLGIVVSLESNLQFLKFLINDGTGCIPCILSLNNDHVTSDLDRELMDMVNASNVRMVKLGEQLSVRGKLTVDEGDKMQITVRDVRVERDPNMEAIQ